MNKPKIYFSAQIRGLLGDECPWDEQVANMDRAIQVCNVFRENFPQYHFECVHENYVINEAVKRGIIDGDEIVDIECAWIRSGEFVSVLVLEPCHVGTGVAREAEAGHDTCKTIFVQNGDEPSRKYFAQMMALLLLDNAGVMGCEQ